MSIRLKNYRNHGSGHVAMCERKEHEAVVREGLAYSPADMARMTDRGMPVNGLNASQVFIDGEENPSFHITSDRKRYVDVADLWEEDQTIREKARNAARARHRAAKAKDK